MIFVFVILFLSFVGVSVFLLWKIPVLVKLEEEEKKDFVAIAKEKIDENIKKELKEIFNEMLQNFLTRTRRLLIKVEQWVTKYLYKIKRKNKENEEENKN